jgi:hypothetical protein
MAAWGAPELLGEPVDSLLIALDWMRGFLSVPGDDRTVVPRAVDRREPPPA